MARKRAGDDAEWQALDAEDHGVRESALENDERLDAEGRNEADGDDTSRLRDERLYEFHKRVPQRAHAHVNEIYVSRGTRFGALFARALHLLLNKREPEVVIHGMGAATQTACELALKLTRDVAECQLLLAVHTHTVTVIDDFEPVQPGLPLVTRSRNVSAVRIRVYRAVVCLSCLVFVVERISVGQTIMRFHVMRALAPCRFASYSKLGLANRRAFSASTGSLNLMAAAATAANQHADSRRRYGAALGMLTALGSAVTLDTYLHSMNAEEHPRGVKCDAGAGSSRKAAENGAATINVEHDVEMNNWSDTFRVNITRVYRPESEQELVALFEQVQGEGISLRPVGSALSPNGLAFEPRGMVSMALMDKILDVNTEKMQVRVQAGAKVSDVVQALRPYGLTLQNYASIAEQQIGGFVNAGAHGTGAAIPPVDCQVVAMKLVTPALGTILLNADDHKELLNFVRVGLGTLGIASEYTLQCVRAHELIEHTFVASRTKVKANHEKWLKENQHIRYMWIPYTDSVVVVACNPVTPELEAQMNQHQRSDKAGDQAAAAQAKESAIQYLRTLYAHNDHREEIAWELLRSMSFPQLRDRLLACDPLNVEHVQKVNTLEAQFWSASSGYRRDVSDRILGFDCGGQQWVSEVAFPLHQTHGDECPKDVDLVYMDSLLKLIEENRIAAPAPIEQRWTCASPSELSPAYSKDASDVFSWVGIIMYLPTEDELPGGEERVKATRNAITTSFQEYRARCAAQLWTKYHANEHWGKLTLPFEQGPNAVTEWKDFVRRSIGEEKLEHFNAFRKACDPNGILLNDTLRTIFGA
ncbi:L-galactono-1,4-lactone dehydrogenase 2, mitochondrial [Porphyridium purpureum]|uniref:L-galactono-1,4-lactone dehydrogenase 2, mitochondrial n=1 Tax=Porphyridium purpureum TaxID=35688 RepID=A0A5J4Z4E6_PORPP|nr:L-galactono-1,4-lactone dehydrogenase 2, mitochondrial [Porphyridium purpureum]|eukprot:POR9158..scf295_1